MYDYYYNKLKPRYGEKVEVLYTDTDSLLLEIETDDVYKDMKEDIDLYDTSDFPEGHYLQTNKNKKVPGKMKDEMAGTPIREYVGLRSKMYSILTENQRIISKAKGVSRATLKNIKHELFLESLKNGSKFRHEMKRIRSKNHMIYMESLNKVSISPLDTKRWLLDDGVNTYSYGNYMITNDRFELAIPHEANALGERLSRTPSEPSAKSESDSLAAPPEPISEDVVAPLANNLDTIEVKEYSQPLVSLVVPTQMENPSTKLTKSARSESEFTKEYLDSLLDLV